MAVFQPLSLIQQNKVGSAVSSSNATLSDDYINKVLQMRFEHVLYYSTKTYKNYSRSPDWTTWLNFRPTPATFNQSGWKKAKSSLDIFLLRHLIN